MGIEIRDGQIRCDHDAFPRFITSGMWEPAAAPDGAEAWRAEMYDDPDAGPGQVRSLVADIWQVNGSWHMRMHGTLIDDDGTVHAGIIGKYYTDLKSKASGKMCATRSAHHLARGSAAQFVPDHVEAWRPGDWVIDAAGAVWVRAADEDAAAGLAWGRPPGTARRQRANRSVLTIPAGRAGDEAPARPLALLIRDGYPVRY